MKTALLTLSLLGSGILVANLNAKPQRPERPDPETVVVDLFEFDADENGSLNATELATGFAELQERRMAEMEDAQADEDADLPPPPPQRKKGKRGAMDPEEMAAGLVEDFDTDGDAELDTAELLEAVTATHSRGKRGPGRGPRGTDSE
ncbi:hypothetical protein [Pelagicoccus albus]|uniref:EF-hand domain-containing protein n=1 Tax=Pelagicoccus albus TaxID=415222 RepID=A0A7X1B4B5_9BACT|nr:hypothetical protein [Pelagicoccus albus]MBC2605393.1 hypothetical protein [Pelagicoccus albus]